MKYLAILALTTIATSSIAQNMDTALASASQLLPASTCPGVQRDTLEVRRGTMFWYSCTFRCLAEEYSANIDELDFSSIKIGATSNRERATVTIPCKDGKSCARYREGAIGLAANLSASHSCSNIDKTYSSTEKRIIFGVEDKKADELARLLRTLK